jgi:hypothetical protein
MGLEVLRINIRVTPAQTSFLYQENDTEGTVSNLRLDDNASGVTRTAAVEQRGRTMNALSPEGKSVRSLA